MNDLENLCWQWAKSYQHDAIHALKDAQVNLHGFTPNLQFALKHYSVDYAFNKAIRWTLQQLGAK